jgi:imidazolonepropionase
MLDLVLVNAGELVTINPPEGGGIKKGKAMEDAYLIKNAGLVSKQGKIIDIGESSRIKKDYKGAVVLDAKEKSVIPSFIDPHTHAVFAGDRANEFLLQIKGKSYKEILAKGGGILKTVKATRNASPKELKIRFKKVLDEMLSYGTTTLEIKSGYGLDEKTEEKIIGVIDEVRKEHPIDLVKTFLGAHALPPEFDRADDYIDFLIGRVLPKLSSKVQFVDVFCEEGVFNLKQSRKMLEAGKRSGLQVKLHADEFYPLGGAELAAAIGAISADHLLHASDRGIKEIIKKGVIPVLLPAASFSLGKNYADARKMIDFGGAVALATDFNPNCLCASMQFVIALACRKMGMTPAEALCASTINAAKAINKEREAGSLEIGKNADFLILDAPSYVHIPYKFGGNIIETVVKNGRIVWSKR